jgi:hypothetical protein
VPTSRTGVSPPKSAKVVVPAAVEDEVVAHEIGEALEDCDERAVVIHRCIPRRMRGLARAERCVDDVALVPEQARELERGRIAQRHQHWREVLGSRHAASSQADVDLDRDAKTKGRAAEPNAEIGGEGRELHHSLHRVREEDHPRGRRCVLPLRQVEKEALDRAGEVGLARDHVGVGERLEQRGQERQVEHEEALRASARGDEAEQIDRGQRLLDDAKPLRRRAAGDRVADDVDVGLHAIEIDEDHGRADRSRIEIQRELVEVRRGRKLEGRRIGIAHRGARSAAIRGDGGHRWGHAAREVGRRAGGDGGEESTTADAHGALLLALSAGERAASRWCRRCPRSRGRA